eukprot:9477765-Pyramimonas_sp.AAC.1
MTMSGDSDLSKKTDENVRGEGSGVGGRGVRRGSDDGAVASRIEYENAEEVVEEEKKYAARRGRKEMPRRAKRMKGGEAVCGRSLRTMVNGDMENRG